VGTYVNVCVCVCACVCMPVRVRGSVSGKCAIEETEKVCMLYGSTTARRGLKRDVRIISGPCRTDKRNHLRSLESSAHTYTHAHAHAHTHTNTQPPPSFTPGFQLR